MRLVIQRVAHAEVAVEGRTIAKIGPGFLVLAGVEVNDEPSDAKLCAAKVAGLRVFRDAGGKMNLALKDVGGEVLVVSQFTLLGDISGGRRPSFIRAARPEQAVPLLDVFLAELRSQELPVKTGEFGADMAVSLTNDGPVTIWFDSKRPSL